MEYNTEQLALHASSWSEPSLLGFDLSTLHPAWQRLAECRGIGKDDPMDNPFFPVQGDMAATIAAKAMCDRCKVRQECEAQAQTEEGGTWAGLSERQRRARRETRWQERHG